ncbi:hypothetical protein MVLG_01579 [Microbotryum lychnidis-dioicae p1A1 Lamole]|uniref:RecQ-mediated genome instability protein 1 n=1 Tax=Microbotryum lychnidis-dioicae (strain p1A1 Lamole / MvSl-1064) TaxID=683840 RepID=U5H2J4_USTV1|nr:hypothetical protein MVLG_01579 [Microbotryum lychnidis-dioicae p1A1 Lamole]|eukprot:KDE08097.1 hypothetical protein MVLG_01579 [Microbotryum lychnidis-dioicae p1A1 Lamole]
MDPVLFRTHTRSFNRSNASSFATRHPSQKISTLHSILTVEDTPTRLPSLDSVTVASAQIPPSLRPWFASSYSPHFQFDPEWLDACVEYLFEHFPNCSQPATLIKKVEEQLLASDLATSTLSPSIATSTLSVPPPSSTHPKHPLFPQKKLVQIISIDEVAYPALGLLETLKDQRSRREIGEEVIEKPFRIGATNEDEDEVPTDQEETVARTWPRGLVKLGLSDGYTAVEAFEKKLVRGLGLGEVKLGCKLLLHNISYTSKFLLLTPDTVTIKGSQVPELEQFAEKQLERTLHRRLGLEVPPDPDLDILEPNAPQPLEENDADSSTEATTIEGDDSLFIDEAAWEEAERKAVEAAKAAVARKSASGGGGGERENGNEYEDGGDDDVIIID